MVDESEIGTRFQMLSPLLNERLFSFISQNWRGKPLVSHETIVNLIAAATTKAGLKVTCELDQSIYPSGI